MFDLTVMEWFIVLLCAMFIGLSKSGIPNMVILVVTVLMFVFPARESIGILLPLLLVGDCFAIFYYRRSVVWKHLISLIPWVLTGILSGYFVLLLINSEQLEPLIGIIVLSMIALHIWRNRLGERFNELLPKSKTFTGMMGILGGFTTMIGNAAGGVMTVYLLVKGLPKKEFVGTSAWFFLSVNLVKVPFYVNLGLITRESITFNAWLVPAVVIGALIGIRILPLIPQKVFATLILVLAAIGGLNLVF
ncbi:sulfite exporter TauE/SafE family protein [Oceanobacillus halophilus]|uniref:Probable membrane transporter protein n=1 Tax=Oceanobacillus halophilus TaxID=930130 RepID=A0A495A7R4_9BACI|nr:sulfite exporter TauE/SafE family protein [Oceanobacillus halophilus]RKQ35832.1 sulfite exporter TauE/SafE family protein [Oceanobacillus halophilus]